MFFSVRILKIIFIIGHGDDAYDILRNGCNLELDGESGDDVFVVRSFAVVEAEDNSMDDPRLG